MYCVVQVINFTGTKELQCQHMHHENILISEEFIKLKWVFDVLL